ncbi:hypothetical protein PFFCH_00374 [Plasmodium falciparum FCH/4]|uniref:Protein phosphatase 1 regulatory subunit 21 N-terminal domain-containing protein n=1 Tax=Plasmodium falciparum FCH/4 TaxID=1036724 RepID=A0A024VV70_PLAFA|nr:hypothetical protein PFFCH_00374 [Plasmodium falciparum FCH/4]
MNVEDRYKLIKEKYKEIKEQNDILKKAIIEYKKDLKELEKKNDILSNDKNQLQKNLTQLTNSLEEQKKKNSGWTNLMLLTKNSRENIHKSVAFEELEMKIKENDTISVEHKKEKIKRKKKKACDMKKIWYILKVYDDKEVVGNDKYLFCFLLRKKYNMNCLVSYDDNILLKKKTDQVKRKSNQINFGALENKNRKKSKWNQSDKKIKDNEKKREKKNEIK